MKETIIKSLHDALHGTLTQQAIAALLEKPKHEAMGDLAFPCFTLAKLLRKAPHHIAEEIAAQLKPANVAKVEVAGGYINFYYEREAIVASVLTTVLKQGKQYGQKPQNGEHIVLDFSAPNIAKPFSMGHLRSTVIGNALVNIVEKNGYQVAALIISAIGGRNLAS